MVEKDPEWVGTKKHGNIPALTFAHEYKGVVKELFVYVWRVRENDKTPADSFVGMNICDENNDHIGSIDGQLFFERDKVRFNTFSISNDTKEDGVSKVPRAIGATIANLVKEGVITTWDSSDEMYLSGDSKRMYKEYLTNDPDLTVFKSPGEDNYFRIRKK